MFIVRSLKCVINFNSFCPALHGTLFILHTERTSDFAVLAHVLIGESGRLRARERTRALLPAALLLAPLAHQRTRLRGDDSAARATLSAYARALRLPALPAASERYHRCARHTLHVKWEARCDTHTHTHLKIIDESILQYVILIMIIIGWIQDG